MLEAHEQRHRTLSHIEDICKMVGIPEHLENHRPSNEHISH